MTAAEGMRMFDYIESKHPHFDAACRAFALANNVEATARAVGLTPQVLRNKLNPDQPHKLTVEDLLAIVVYTDDARLIDGVLAQLNCLPSVPVNEVMNSSVPVYALNATADVGAIAGQAVSDEPLTQARKNAILDRASNAIRNLSLIMLTVESRFQSTPIVAAAVDLVSATCPE